MELIRPNDPRYFTQSSDGPYDRHKYELVYSNGQSEIKEKIISQVELNIPTYRKENLPKELLSIEAVKPGSRNL